LQFKPLERTAQILLIATNIVLETHLFN